MKIYELFLTCPKGLEEVCKQDLAGLNLENLNILDGGLSFNGSINTICQVNLLSRIGMQLLIKVKSFSLSSIKDFYKSIYDYYWIKILNPRMTFSISSNIYNKNKLFDNSQFVSLKAKDAIVDRLIKEKGKRPNVDKINPDLIIKITIQDNMCNIYLNSSGSPLYIRNYKQLSNHKAPINESIASALVYLSNWDKQIALADPLCGSGTICTEASMIKQKIPPGINRNFSFQRWLNYDKDLFKVIRKKLLNNIDESSKINIFGSDINSAYINECKNILRLFRYNLGINFKMNNISSTNYENSTIITNPPYGIRLSDSNNDNFIKNGLDRLLDHGNDIYVIYPEENSFIKDNYDYTILANLYNGSIKCQFYKLHNV